MFKEKTSPFSLSAPANTSRTEADKKKRRFQAAPLVQAPVKPSTDLQWRAAPAPDFTFTFTFTVTEAVAVSPLPSVTV